MPENKSKVKNGYYIKDGKEYVRVTKVIDDITRSTFQQAAWWGWGLAITSVQDFLPDISSLEPELRKGQYAPNSSRNAGVERGKDTHLVLAALAGGYVETAKQIAKSDYSKQLLKWWEKNEIHSNDILASEESVFSERYLYAGTLDLAREGTITDLKTRKTKSARATEFIQGAAYRLAWHEMGKSRIDRVSILVCTPTGFKETFDPDPEKSTEAWLSMLDLWHKMQEMKLAAKAARSKKNGN